MTLPFHALANEKLPAYSAAGEEAMGAQGAVQKPLYNLKASPLHYSFGNKYLKEFKLDSCNFMEGAHEHIAKKHIVKFASSPGQKRLFHFYQGRDDIALRDEILERKPFSTTMKQGPA